MADSHHVYLREGIELWQAADKLGRIDGMQPIIIIHPTLRCIHFNRWTYSAANKASADTSEKIYKETDTHE